MAGLLRALLCALVLTCILEIIPLAFLRPFRRWLGASLICNVLTNPLLNCILQYSYARLSAPEITALTIALEAGVVVCEAVLYRLILAEPMKKCAAVSLGSNAFSYGAGKLMEFLIF